MRRRLIYIKSEAVSSSFEEGKHLLEELGIVVETLPALAFRFKQLDKLKESLECPSNYSGLILTSSRAVEAIRHSLTDLSPLDGWKKLRNYCVGQTTLKKIHTELGDGWSVRGGAETGNADLLSDLVLQDSKQEPTDRPFLFPCSNLALGTLPSRIRTAGYQLEDIEVYETVKHEQLDTRVIEVDLYNVEFILFFSPSTVQYFLESVRIAGIEQKLHSESLKLIAIGPSTKQEMINQGLNVSATCPKPTIECLLEIVKQSSNSQ